jgi:hypothetical protein
MRITAVLEAPTRVTVAVCQETDQEALLQAAADAIWLGWIAKMAAAALVVVATCLVVERVGPRVGAMAATLPVSAGPAYVFLAMQHPPTFVADSALGSLAALGGSAVFATVYAWLAQRYSVISCVVTGLAAWIVTVWIIRAVGTELWRVILLDAALLGVCLYVGRRWRRGVPTGGRRGRRWDIPVRATAAMVLVGTVMLVGRLLGPGAAGIAALAPVVLTSLALLLHPRIGGPGAAAVLANALPGLMGNAIALIFLNRTAEAVGSAAALTLALAICVAWNGAVLGLGAART